MTKKLVALLLVLVLAFGIYVEANASTEYSCSFVNILYSTASSAVDGSHRFAAWLLVDYYGAVSYMDVSRIATSGYGYLVKWPSCVDVYLLRTDGSYLNIFYMPSSGKMSDYGTTYTVSTNGYSKTSFSMSSMWSYINSLGN